VFADEPLRDSPLVVDQTAVGRNVHDLLLHGHTGASAWGWP
jgi:hypothetical protein